MLMHPLRSEHVTFYPLVVFSYQHMKYSQARFSFLGRFLDPRPCPEAVIRSSFHATIPVARRPYVKCVWRDWCRKG